MIKNENNFIKLNNMKISHIMTQEEEDYDSLSLFFKSRPWWTPLHLQLEKSLNKHFPRTLVVSTPHSMTHVFENNINDENYSITTDPVIRLIPMEQSRCHDNVIALMRAKKIDEAGYGYVMETKLADFRWREHSWGLMKDGTIIETTSARRIYVRLNIPLVELKSESTKSKPAKKSQSK
jgi:hypothetical protein